jgi:hypothetical protein
MRRFPMSLDAGNRRLTTVVIGLCAAVLGIQIAVCRPPFAWIPLLTGALLVPIMASCWALAPTALTIDGRTLRIERRGWRPLEIPLDDIARTDGVPSLRPLGAVRLFGVGGFFGSFGLMWSRSIGRFRAYATRSAPSLLLRRRGALPVLVTPDDPEAVVAALRAAGVPA